MQFRREKYWPVIPAKTGIQRLGFYLELQRHWIPASVRDEAANAPGMTKKVVTLSRVPSPESRVPRPESRVPSHQTSSLRMPTDYKNTINLPKTGFAMKADLAQREPKMLAEWEAANRYARLQHRTGNRARAFILHDGPPYANGAIHIGHAVNKILKDIVVKSRGLDGFDSPYIPGWDCHGLPIELQVEKKHGRPGQKLDAAAFRAACRAYAQEQIDLQRADFKRLGVLGDWDHPYLTMAPKYEAQ